MQPETLPQFYALMHSTIPVRRAMTEEILASRTVSPEAVGRLREALAGLEAIPEEAAGRRLVLEGSRAIHVDLGYVIEEREKSRARRAVIALAEQQADEQRKKEAAEQPAPPKPRAKSTQVSSRAVLITVSITIVFWVGMFLLVTNDQ